MNKPIKSADLISFLKENIEPLDDPIYGKRYRASARLMDGTFLPCVVFQARGPQVDLAIRRFKEEASKTGRYRDIVASFVSKGSRVAEWEIASVGLSPWAWPIQLLRTIHGETTMGWTSFVAEMADGSFHSFGTTFNAEFFNLPEGYTYSDIKVIRSGMVYSEESGLTPYALQALEAAQIYRERPFFTCYLDHLL